MKHTTFRSGLTAMIVVLAMGMMTAVFATETEIDQNGTPLPEKIISNSGPDHEELMEGFMEIKSNEELGNPINDKTTRKNRLNPITQVAYERVYSQAKDIADGNEESAVIQIPVTDLLYDVDPIDGKLIFTEDDLGVPVMREQGGELIPNPDAIEKLYENFDIEYKKLLYALLADAPYRLYWFDKTVGMDPDMPNWNLFTGTEDPYLFFTVDETVDILMAVSEDYALGDPNKYLVDKAKTQATVDSARNAADLVQSFESESDYKKLVHYKEEICERVEYNSEAQEEDVPYGDPWQLIWVFDGNYNTNVVCEGYSKAFKFLCDLSTFKNTNTECYMTTGILSQEGQELGPHMWNVLSFGEGNNYLVDVTNCDDDYVWTSDYFLKGDRNGSADAYTILDLGYSYDPGTKDTFDDAERRISETDFDLCGGIHEAVTSYMSQPTCTRPGREERTICSKCGIALERAEAIPALGHEYSDSWIRYDENIHVKECTRDRCNKHIAGCHVYEAGEIVKKPTYTEAGKQKYVCKDCGDDILKELPMLPRTSLAKATVTGIAARTYSGKALTQTPTVRLSGKTLKKGTDYDLTYKNNKLVGRATVTITGINAYKGTLSKTFKINPKGTTIKKLKALNNGFTATWTKQATQTTGYQLQYCLKSNFKSGAKTLTIAGAKKVSRKVVKLKNKKAYFVRVRTYKTVSGVKYYSGWSKAKKVKTK